MAQDAVICLLCVTYILAGEGGHVTADAIWILSVMLLGESAAMTRNAFVAKVSRYAGGFRLRMRIVTCGTTHFVSGGSLAAALSECLELTHRTLPSVVRKDEIANEIKKVISWLEAVYMPMRSLDARISLEMTLHAYFVAAIRRQMLETSFLFHAWRVPLLDRGTAHR